MRNTPTLCIVMTGWSETMYLSFQARPGNDRWL